MYFPHPQSSRFETSKEITMPVTKGDILAIDAATLTQKEVHVVWQQSLKTRSQDYYLVTYTNTTRSQSLAPSIGLIALIFLWIIVAEVENSGLLFIQKNRLDAFKGKQVAGQKQITFKVDDSFQCGQDRSQKNRWLAFHDKPEDVSGRQYPFFSASLSVDRRRILTLCFSSL